MPLEGLVREGLYLVLHAQQAIGFAHGTVKGVNGFGYQGDASLSPVKLRVAPGRMRPRRH